MKVKKVIGVVLGGFVIAGVVSVQSISHAWSGYNYGTDNSIEAESYDHRGIGEGEVEFYDYYSGEYRSGY